MTKYTTLDFLEAGAYRKGLTTSDIRDMLGWSRQTLSQMMKRDTMKLSVFREVMEDKLGYEMFFRDKITGEELHMGMEGDRISRPGRFGGHGRRVKYSYKNIVYDTANADALADSFYLDGEHEYTDGFAQELYKDRKGRYFIVTYSDHDGDRDQLKGIDEDLAMRFINAYGTLEERQEKMEKQKKAKTRRKKKTEPKTETE